MISKTVWPCFLQRKTAHCAADGKEPGGAIAACGAAGAGKGADAGIHGATSRRGSQGNRAGQICQVPPASAAKPSKMWRFQGVD